MRSHDAQCGCAVTRGWKAAAAAPVCGIGSAGMTIWSECSPARANSLFCSGQTSYYGRFDRFHPRIPEWLRGEVSARTGVARRFVSVHVDASTRRDRRTRGRRRPRRSGLRGTSSFDIVAELHHAEADSVRRTAHDGASAGEGLRGGRGGIPGRVRTATRAVSDCAPETVIDQQKIKRKINE